MILRERIWRVVCSYKGAEARGQNRDVTLAIPKRSSPLQVIEKRKFMYVPKLTQSGLFVKGQTFGGNGKLLGNYAAYRATDPEHFRGVGSI
jgi:hypothetical protein